MPPSQKVLERKLFHAGQVFIRAGEQNLRAYVIQKGMVRSYIEEDGEKLEVGQHGPGTIIGETCLILDDPLTINYEAVSDTTVVTISRQDFEKKLAVADSTIKTILRHVIDKIGTQEKTAVKTARQGHTMDDSAQMFVNAIVAGLREDKKTAYKEAIAGPVSALINAIKAVKARFKAEEKAGGDEKDEGTTLVEKAAELLSGGNDFDAVESESEKEKLRDETE